MMAFSEVDRRYMHVEAFGKHIWPVRVDQMREESERSGKPSLLWLRLPDAGDTAVAGFVPS